MYEMIGEVVVVSIVAILLATLSIILIRALLVIWIRIRAHCFLLIGVKEEYKKKSFYKLRLFLKLLQGLKYLLEEGFWGSEIIYPSHVIDFNTFIPRIIKK